MQEIWKNVPEHPNYQASTLGRIRRTYKKKTGYYYLTPFRDWKGYLRANLNGKGCSWHRIIALTFIPNPNGYKQVNHLDEDKENNRVENLEWCNAKRNTNYGDCIKNRVRTRTNYCVNSTRTVEQIDMESNKVLATFYCIGDAYEAMKTSRKSGSITRAIKENIPWRGYLWRYADTNQRRKVIGQFKDGELVATYSSQRKAAVAMGCSVRNTEGVFKALRGYSKSYRGYEWKYIDPEKAQGKLSP